MPVPVYQNLNPGPVGLDEISTQDKKKVRVQPPVTPGELYTTCLPSGPCTRHPAAPALPCELQALYESKLQISTSHGVDQIGAICADDIGPHLHNRLHRALIHARRV